MTTESKGQPREGGHSNSSPSKFYIKRLNWIDIIPGYITKGAAKSLSQKEKEKHLKAFERPELPFPDLPPLARVRLFKQSILGAQSIHRFDYNIQDPRPIPDIREEWKLELYIQNKRREWFILEGAEWLRAGKGKPFYLDLWANLDTIDLIQSEKFAYWEVKAARIQYEFRTKLSTNNKGRYLASYFPNSSGYNQGPFRREFHRKQTIKELPFYPDHLANLDQAEALITRHLVKKYWSSRSP